MAENMENQDSGLLVDLGVLSATGVAGTALFFRGASNPGFLNDMAIKANFALQEGRRLWVENRSGIERISISDISETWDRANQRFEDLKGHSINFKVQDTPELDRILNYYKYTLDSHDLLKTFYRNESARVGYQSLRSLGLNQGTALYATIHDAIQSYVARPGDLETIYNNLAGRLDLDQYKEAVDYLNYIVSDINNWQAENTFDNWKTGRGQHIVDQVRQQFNKTPLELLEEQNRRKQSLGNRFERLVFGSDNEVTIGELLDILQNGTEAEKEEIRGYFDRGTEVALNTTEVLEKEGFDQKTIARARNEIGNLGTTILRGNEVLLHYYNNLSDKDKFIFGQLTVDDLRRTVDGRLYTTSDFKRTLLNISDEVASTAPASLLHFQDLTFQALNRQNFYVSRIGDADFSTNEFFGHYTKDIEDWTYVSINGSFYEYNHDTGELIERTDLQGKGTIRSTNAGLARRVARTFNDAEVAPELDKSTLSGYLGLYAEHRPNTREFGNNAYLYGTFNDSNYRFIKQAVDTISNQTNRSEEEVYNARRVLAGLNRYTNFLTKYSFVDDLNSVRSLLDHLNASNPRLDRSIQALKAYIDLEENHDVV